jgi:hypothetical protein
MVLDDEVCFTYRRHSGSVSAEAAPNGTWFVEAGAFFAGEEEKLKDLGWPRAARAARTHLASRLHAAAVLPTALLARNPDGVRALARHAFGR